jgi:hypothetical protein
MTPQRLVSHGAAVGFIGAATSGLVGFLIVGATRPQPDWRDAETFARSYHAIQALPYFCGFLLVGGMVVTIAGLHALARPEHRGRTAAALALAGAFAAMIFTNYAIQTTLVPALATPWDSSHAALLSAVTMANPRSLGWALEMWGYAVLGAATWLSAAALKEGASGIFAQLAAALFVANGPLSIGAAMLTAVVPGWVLTTAGLAAFTIWNALMLCMTLLTALVMRGARQSADTSQTTPALPAAPVA